MKSQDQNMQKLHLTLGRYREKMICKICLILSTFQNVMLVGKKNTFSRMSNNIKLRDMIVLDSKLTRARMKNHIHSNMRMKPRNLSRATPSMVDNQKLTKYALEYSHPSVMSSS